MFFWRLFYIYFCIFFIFIQSAPSVLAGQTQIGDTSLSYDLNGLYEAVWGDTVYVYNTGAHLVAKNHQISVEARTALNGPLEEIKSEDFDLNRFVKELTFNYSFDPNETSVVVSFGKMTTGAKTDMSNAQDIGGVMGFRLSLKPDKIEALKDWLSYNDYYIRKVQITRYDSGSGSRLDFNDLNQTDMTAVGLYMANHSHTIDTFLILKEPDRSSHSPRGVSVGGVYAPGGKWDPQFFALYHQSQADYLDLKIYVVDVDFKTPIDGVRAELVGSRAVEGKSHYREDYYGISAHKVLSGDASRRKSYVEGTLGYRKTIPSGSGAVGVERKDELYMQIHMRYE